MATVLDQFDVIFGRGRGTGGFEEPLPLLAANGINPPAEAAQPSSNFLLRFFSEGGPRYAIFLGVLVLLAIACALVESFVAPLPLS